MRDVEDAVRHIHAGVRVKIAARLRLEVAQGEGHRHYVLAVGAGDLVDDDEGEVRLARRENAVLACRNDLAATYMGSIT